MLKLITKIRLKMIIRYSFFGVLAMRLILVEGFAPDVKTMAVDGKHLFFNSDYCATLSDAEIMGVIVHEVLHCTGQHFARKGNRDHLQWNIAADYAINPLVIDAGFSLPVGALIDSKFYGLGAEEIYRLREIEAKENPGAPQPTDCGFGEVIEPKADSDSAVPGNASSGEIDQLKTDWEIATRQAVMIEEKRSGKGDGLIQSIAAQIAIPDFDWRGALTDWVNDSVQTISNWNQPNRRFVHTGLYLPTNCADGIDHLVFGIDTSGSMDSGSLDICFAHIAELLESGFIAKITVIQTDTKIHQVDEYETGDSPKLEIFGCGGTDFNELMETVKDSYSDASGLIVFTDLEIGKRDVGNDPAIPVLWAVSGTTRQFETYSKIPTFGEAVHIC